MVRPKASEPSRWVWFAGIALIWPAILLVANFFLSTLAYFIPWDIAGYVVQIAGVAAVAWLVSRLAYRSGAPRALWIVIAVFSAVAASVNLFSHVFRFGPTLFGLLYAMTAPAVFFYESRRPQPLVTGIEQALQPDASQSVQNAGE